MTALALTLLLACAGDKAADDPTPDDSSVDTTVDTTDSGSPDDTGDVGGDDTGASSVLCADGGPQALFVGTDGATVDWTDALHAATAEAPIEIGLYEPGLLSVCPGEWYIYIRAESDVLIRGAGADATTLNASGRSAVIRTKGDYQLDVQGLTLRGGLSQHGGGLYATNGASVRIVDCVIEDNTVHVDGHGGGVCVSERSEASLVGVTFRGNSAAEGGGLAVMSSAASLVDVVFEGNSAEGTYFPGYGGGLFTEGSSVAIDGAVFRDNVAASDGGGLAVWYGSSLTLHSADFEGNAAGDGAGLHVLFGEITASDLRFEGNLAEGSGGAAEVRFGALTLSASTASGNSAERGGGLALEESTLALGGVGLTDNSAAEGGGLYIDAYSVASGVDCDLSSNTPDDLFHAAHGAQAPAAAFTCDPDGCR